MNVPAAHRAAQRGMTLIEILVVITILGIIAAAVAVNVVGQLDEAKVKQAKTDLHTLENCLDLYKIDKGRYPSTEEGLQALVAQPSGEPNWAGPYLKKGVPADPWGRPYVYQQPGTHSGDFDLQSYGKDGRPGGTGEDADLTNF